MNEEYNRVLSNPDNIIVSEGLEGILSEAFVAPDSSVLLLIGDEVHLADLCSFYKKMDTFKFELEVQHLSIRALSYAQEFCLKTDGIKFVSNGCFEYAISDGKSILILEDMQLVSEVNDG